MLLTKQELKEIHTYLKKLSSGEVKPLVTHGLCINISATIPIHAEDVSEFINTVAQTWNSYSGNELYPVPSTDITMDAATAYQYLHLWEGDYGKFRMDLCNYLISYIEKEYPEVLN